MSANFGADFNTLSVSEALGVTDASDLISIVGGGGKSALLFRLGHDLPGYTVLTTTTRIFASQTSRAQMTCRMGTPALEKALAIRQEGLLVIGEVVGDKAMGVSAEVPAEILAAPGVDFVVVEADGSRMRPTKAPADHEPVVSVDTTLFVVVAGIDALDGSISETCHRPERVAALLGVSPKDTLNADRLAELLCHPEGGLKGAPSVQGTRVTLLINKVESPDHWEKGRAVAAACRRKGGADRVVLGAIEPGGSTATSSGGGDFEVWR
jgi:molybdenum cofactor cytidylyltransferase